jgi:hypothetical protein
MNEINLSVLYNALKKTPFAEIVTTCKEITSFDAEDIKDMKSVKQAMCGVIKITDTLVSTYYLFTCFDNNPDLFGNAKPLYNFIALDNNQIFKIN